ncbi:MAG: outer membrane protein assembly factor BamD [Kofleriaceae bacterium]
MTHVCDGGDRSCTGCAAVARRHHAVYAAMTRDDRLDDITRARIWSRVEERLDAEALRPAAWRSLGARRRAATGIAVATAVAAAAGAAVVLRDRAPAPRALTAAADTTLTAPLGPYTRAALVGPARLELVGPPGEATVVRLHAGALLADFDNGPGRSLRVETRVAAVDVVGTLFAVEVRATGTCTSVAHGKVAVTTPAGVTFVGGGERYCTGDGGGPGPIEDAVRDALAHHQPVLAARAPVASPAELPATTMGAVATRAKQSTIARSSVTAATPPGAVMADPAEAPEAPVAPAPALADPAAAPGAPALAPAAPAAPVAPTPAPAPAPAPLTTTTTATTRPAVLPATSAAATPVALPATSAAARPAALPATSAAAPAASVDAPAAAAPAALPATSAAAAPAASVDAPARAPERSIAAAPASVEAGPRAPWPVSAAEPPPSPGPTTAPPAPTVPPPPPRTAEALYRTAEMALAARDLAAADRALERLLAEFPGAALVDQALYERARIAYHQRAWSAARRQLDRLAALPRSPLAEPGHYLACRIAVEARDAEAEQCLLDYRRAHPRSPHDRDVLGLLVQLAHARGGCEAAAPLLAELTRDAPRSGLAASWRAHCPGVR